MSNTFIDQALSGDALLIEIDDYVDAWNCSSTTQSLHEFLGLTPDEYSLWVSEPDMLSHIILARREHMSLEEVIRAVVNDDQPLEKVRLAARSNDVAKVNRLMRWLRNTGIELS